MAIVYGSSNPETVDQSDDVTELAAVIYRLDVGSIIGSGDNDLIFWGEAAQPPPCCSPR
jgi:hypothetical protein